MRHKTILSVLVSVSVMVLTVIYVSNTHADKPTVQEKIDAAFAASPNGAVGMELSKEEIREFLLSRGLPPEEVERRLSLPEQMMENDE